MHADQEAIESGQRVEWSAEDNYKFRMAELQQPLIEWLERNPGVIQPRGMYERVLAEVRSGLADLSVSPTRARLHWGVPVPGDMPCFLITSHSDHGTLGVFLRADGEPTARLVEWPSHPRAVVASPLHLVALLRNNTIHLHDLVTVSYTHLRAHET